MPITIGAGLLLSFMYIGRFVEIVLNPLGSVKENTNTMASASSLHTLSISEVFKIKINIIE